MPWYAWAGLVAYLLIAPIGTWALCRAAAIGDRQGRNRPDDPYLNFEHPDRIRYRYRKGLS